MIELKGLYKSFEDKTVLTDINATFENGKTNLIIGQSGSGKTVLMKCIVGLLTPERGELLYDGRNFLVMNKKEKKLLRREMGMLFQSAALFDSMTVMDNVMFPLNMFSNDTLRDRQRRARFCLDRVNLTDAGRKYPGEISGGMQKRVAIARAIALNPQYLFCDEPNSGLDPKTSLVIDALIQDITREYNMENHLHLPGPQGMGGDEGRHLHLHQPDAERLHLRLGPLQEGQGGGDTEPRRLTPAGMASGDSRNVPWLMEVSACIVRGIIPYHSENYTVSFLESYRIIP